ncbi:MAG: chloramphenicol acetyltransferase [Lachnospiraceae bacterium]|nr:chloramphenicol acetyltransferase [Lachnospiraceae bacterium]
MQEYDVVDLKNWERKMHYEIFRQYENPRYDISFELDITSFYQKIKSQNLSFTLSFIHAVATAANEIEAFRYRFEDGQPVLYHKISGISFTYLNFNTELMKNVVVELKDDSYEFVLYAKKIAQEQKAYFTGPLGNGIYQFSCIPWISYTHISHTDSGKKDNAVPIFDWGKYVERDGRKLLPFSVQVHHSFVDGIHIEKFAERLQQHLNEN